MSVDQVEYRRSSLVSLDIEKVTQFLAMEPNRRTMGSLPLPQPVHSNKKPKFSAQTTQIKCGRSSTQLDAVGRGRTRARADSGGCRLPNGRTPPPRRGSGFLPRSRVSTTRMHGMGCDHLALGQRFCRCPSDTRPGRSTLAQRKKSPQACGSHGSITAITNDTVFVSIVYSRSVSNLQPKGRTPS